MLSRWTQALTVIMQHMGCRLECTRDTTGAVSRNIINQSYLLEAESLVSFDLKQTPVTARWLVAPNSSKCPRGTRHTSHDPFNRILEDMSRWEALL